MKRIRDYGIVVGTGKVGRLNKITDVPGVKVGHHTIQTDTRNTGVTVVVPGDGNIFKNKFVAASHVINGFCKTTGLVQVDELGTIETPIALTGVLNVGKVSDALISYTLKQDGNEDVNSINPVVMECNDSLLNESTDRLVGESAVMEAIETASIDFEEGAVGGGTGMTCFGMKGGIGSASRLTFIDGKYYTIGVLVQTNFGGTGNFILNGNFIGDKLVDKISNVEDKGSIVIVVATDLPLSERQLKRLIKRSEVGIIRTGSFLSPYSGDVVVGFSTANRIDDDKNIRDIKVISEEKLAYAIRMVGEATEEAILNSLACSKKVITTSKTDYSFADIYLDDYIKSFNYEAFIESVPAVNQFPDYPVGCESVALYELLKAYNVDVTVEDIVEKLRKGYAPYEENGILYGGDPEIEFLGDPRDYRGWGVYEKPIEDVANLFKPGIKNITGASLDDVLKLVKEGFPVQVWITIKLTESFISRKWINKETGKEIEWKRNLHSVVVVGYSDKYVVVADPDIGAIKRYDRKTFEDRYNYLGKRALYYEEKIVKD